MPDIILDQSTSDAPRSTVTTKLRASQEARVIGIRLHTADVALGRVTDQPWASLTPSEKASYDGRGALAVHTGDVATLDRAIEDAALALRLRFNPEIVTSMDLARALARRVISTWMTSMSKGVR